MTMRSILGKEIQFQPFWRESVSTLLEISLLSTSVVLDTTTCALPPRKQMVHQAVIKNFAKAFHIHIDFTVHNFISL